MEPEYRLKSNRLIGVCMMEKSLFSGPGARAFILGRMLFALFAAMVSLTALGEVAGIVNTPLVLELGVGARAPWAFALHMASGGAALAAILLTLSVPRGGRWHRASGRVAAACVVLAAASAYPVALASTASDLTRASFVTQATIWLALLVAGVLAIRRGHVAGHRRAMSLMAAAAMGAVLLRVLLSLHSVLFPFSDFALAYGVIAWTSWTLPLAGTALYLRARPRAGA